MFILYDIPIIFYVCFTNKKKGRTDVNRLSKKTIVRDNKATE